MKSILACLVLMAAIAHAQDEVSGIPSYGIYTSASAFNSHQLTDSFTAADNNHKLKDEVTHQVDIINNGSAHKYSYNSIWGFRRKGDDWRIFDNHIFKVVYTGKACVYIRPAKTDFSVPGLTRFETTYFSAAPDSPVYPLTQNNLLLVFKNDSSLVNKVNALPPSALVTKIDKSSGMYEFINWL